MERVGTLINKLKDQFEQNVETEKLLITAQLLLTELQQAEATKINSGKVTVVLPGFYAANNSAVNIQFPESKPNKSSEHKQDIKSGWLFEEDTVIPTLAHQENKEIFELNDTIAEEKESINDKLKEATTEVAHVLQGTQIRDLRKGIGINDRYLFINELFRGDENMYERSIKTINAFNIFPEAEYWIQRELKVKLGWNEQSNTVQIFNQIVKRRFS